MKILVLTSRFPYPVEKGDKLRIYHQIKELSLYNEIILCAISEEEVQDEDFKKISELCTQIHIFPLTRFQIFLNLVLAIFRGLPLQVSYFYKKSIKKQLATIIDREKPDHLYCQLIRTSEYIRDFDLPKTIDYMDAFSTSTERWAGRTTSFFTQKVLEWEARNLAKYEQAIFPYFTNHTIISNQDRNLLKVEDKKSIFIIPNGVDFDYFKPPVTAEQKYDLVFVGNMGYKPNVEAVKFLVGEILPIVRQTYPEIKVLIAGARPTPEIRRLNSLQVTISGWVDDIRDAYASASIFVAPLFLGAGLQNKILEAMSMGLPCITSSLVNNAIKAKPGTEILIADDAETFAKSIITLYNDQNTRNEISREGQLFVEKNFSWKNFVNQLENIIKYHGK